ncbi:hypothetical protein AN1V17_20660 [Vallitalea sediminicola]
MNIGIEKNRISCFRTELILSSQVSLISSVSAGTNKSYENHEPLSLLKLP